MGVSPVLGKKTSGSKTQALLPYFSSTATVCSPEQKLEAVKESLKTRPEGEKSWETERLGRAGTEAGLGGSGDLRASTYRQRRPFLFMRTFSREARKKSKSQKERGSDFPCKVLACDGGGHPTKKGGLLVMAETFCRQEWKKSFTICCMLCFLFRHCSSFFQRNNYLALLDE